MCTKMEYNTIMIGGDIVTKHYEQRKEANKRYLSTQDEIKVRTPKGQKEIIKAHADLFDDGSVNKFINRAIEETIARDKEKPEG